MTVDWQWTSKTQATKEKLDKFEYIKSKNVCIKGHYQQIIKVTHRIEETIHKSYLIRN